MCYFSHSYDLSKSYLCDKGFILAHGGKSMAEFMVWVNVAGISHIAADQEAGKGENR